MKRICLLVVLAGLLVCFGSQLAQAVEKKTDLERVTAIMAKNKLLPAPKFDLKKGTDIAKSFRLPNEKMIVVGGIFDSNGKLVGLFGIFEEPYQPNNQMVDLFSELIECGTGISRHNDSLRAMTQSVVKDTKSRGEFCWGNIQGATLSMIKGKKNLIAISFNLD